MDPSSSHQIRYRMIPLICQALTTSPSEDQVWLEGFRLLASPKLRSAMTITSSIWLPLLLKGLDTNRGRPVIIAALKLLEAAAESLDSMKSCLVKPLRILGKNSDVSRSEELTFAVERLGLSDEIERVGAIVPNLVRVMISEGDALLILSRAKVSP